MSLKKRIFNYIRKVHDANPLVWINGGHIEQLAASINYKASNASRRLRELENEGKIKRRENGKGHVEYKLSFVEWLYK